MRKNRTQLLFHRKNTSEIPFSGLFTEEERRPKEYRKKIHGIILKILGNTFSSFHIILLL